MLLRRLLASESVRFLPVLADDRVLFEESDLDAVYMPEAEERLALLRKDGWRLEFLSKWFALQVRQRRVPIETDASLKKWVFDRFRLFAEGERSFRYQSFLRVLCIQQRFPKVSDGELMLAAMIVEDALDYYKKKGRW